jgi:hypothetical protein
VFCEGEEKKMANTLHQLKRATEIVERYRQRGNVFPRELRDCGRGDPVSQQEYRDACKVKTWKYSLLGKNIYNCSDEVRDYLDENMPGWCDRVYSHQGQSSNIQMQKAVKIVERYRERGNVLPRRLKDPAKAQETKDAINISTWKSSLKGYNRVTCSKELCAYLDENMPGWRKDHHKSKPRSAQGKEKARLAELAGTTIGELEKRERSSELLMPIAQGIVERFRANNNQYPSLKLACRKDPSRAQEYADAKQLHSWKSHTDKTLAPDVFKLLDEQMPDWKNSHVLPTNKNSPIAKAREIFRRCSMRNGAIPKLAPSRPTDPVAILEHNDALKLREWKIQIVENATGFCPLLKNYLDEKLPEWRNIDIITPLPFDAKAEKAKAIALATLQKRERTPAVRDTKRKTMSPMSHSGTDNEFSSSDSSSCGSDDEIDSMPSNKRAKISTSFSNVSIDFDESAGIAALMQLSSSADRSLDVKPSPVVSATPCAINYKPSPIPSFIPLLLPAPSFSTYGNGKTSQSCQPPINSFYPAPTSSGLELYLTGMVGRS